MAFFRDDSGGTARAVGDRAGNVCRPDRGPVFADGRADVQTFQLLQRGTGADTAGEKLCLTLGDRALDGRWRFDGAALEIITDQLRGIEVRAQQYGIGQHMGQRPMGIEWGAESGQGGEWFHVGHFAGLAWRWVVVEGLWRGLLPWSKLPIATEGDARPNGRDRWCVSAKNLFEKRLHVRPRLFIRRLVVTDVRPAMIAVAQAIGIRVAEAMLGTVEADECVVGAGLVHFGFERSDIFGSDHAVTGAVFDEDFRFHAAWRSGGIGCQCAVETDDTRQVAHPDVPH